MFVIYRRFELQRLFISAGIMALLLFVFPFPSLAQTLIFEENFEDANLADRGWYDGAGNAGYRFVYDAEMDKNVMYQEWTALGNKPSGDPAIPDDVTAALRYGFTPTEEITVHMAVKYHKYIEFPGNNHHVGVGRGYGTYSALNGPLTTYIEPQREGHGTRIVYSNGELIAGTAAAVTELEALGFPSEDISRYPMNSFPLTSKTFTYVWREPVVSHTDTDNQNIITDDVWYEVVLNTKTSTTDAKVVLMMREFGAGPWTTLSNESGFNMGGDETILFNQFWVGSYLHNNRQEGARAYLSSVRVYEGDAVSMLTGALVPGDFDADGDVDGADFLQWQRDTSVESLPDWEDNFGASSPLAATRAVPEPTTVALSLLAAIGLLAGRRHSSFFPYWSP